MTSPLDPRHRIVLVSDSGPIPSFYVRFLDPIALITDNYNVVPLYAEGAAAITRSADLLVVQRWVSTPMRRIVDDAKARGIPIVYETDDNMLDLPSHSSMRMSEELLDNVKAMLALADLVICSTPALADAMARYNSHVRVIENYGLDKPEVDVSGRPHLAVVNTDYFKLSGSKQDFFRAVSQAIEDLDYRVTFFGSVDAAMITLRERFPAAVEIIDGFVDERSAFLDRLSAHGVNVAAVPLDDTEHHLVKSDIKFLDFASLGIPGIFNNPRVYAAVRHQVDGYMTADTQAGWFDALRYFADPDHRRDCGQAARDVVATSRGLTHYADQLATLYAQLLGDTQQRNIFAAIDRGRSGFFWQGENLVLLHDGVKHHVTTKLVIAALIEDGFGFIEPRVEEFALAAAPKALFEPRQILSLAPSGRTSLRAPVPAAARALRIAWIVPRLIIGGGGHRNIIRCAYHLEQLGHDVSLHFIDSHDPGDVVATQVREHFYPLRGHIGLLNDAFPKCDIAFATHWSTVAPAEDMQDRIGEIVYFVQDFEPFFYAMGSEYVLAETTYRKGFYAITSGIWCEHFLRDSYGAEADHFQFPIDRTIYFDRKAARRRNRVIFFAKPEMPRRCYEIGVQALRRFHTLQPDVEIVFYGSSHQLPVDFPVTQLGMLPGPDDLAKLYNEAMVGIAFSTTNPSLVPYEMMACGLPVVDLARTGNEMNYDGRLDIARLANPDPSAMAGEIAALIANRDELASRSANGLAFTGTFPVEADVGRRIEGLLLNRVRAWGNAAGRHTVLA
jgi:glycosyltransferase involved in cell wall biosynthesis